MAALSMNLGVSAPPTLSPGTWIPSLTLLSLLIVVTTRG